MKDQVKKPGELRYNEDGLIPAIVQDVDSKEVLMLAYMNEESLQRTLETGKTWFWSRSRQCFWQKGETSGHIQEVDTVKYDCDADTLLIKVRQTGVACHTGHYSCFFNVMQEKTKNRKFDVAAVLPELARVIRERLALRPEGSYVASLQDGGIKTISRKVGEEALETIIACMGDETDEAVVREAADLLFHLMVLLESRGVAFTRVLEELARRRAGDEHD